MAKKNVGKWMDDIYNSLGRFASIETMDGSNRSGKVSGFRSRQLVLNGKEVDVLTDLELNGDPTDCIEFTLVRRLTFEGEKD